MFKIGQKVVCIKPQPPYTVQNEIYTVTGVNNCGCGKQQISFGIPHNKTNDLVIGCTCGKYTPSNDPYYYSFSIRFRHLHHEFAEEVIAKLLEEENAVTI